MQIRELGHAVLYVSSLERAADFYKGTLGFREIVRRWPIAAFSAGRTHHELLLIEVGPKTPSPEEARRRAREPRLGLYHLGFKVADSPEELRGVYKELVDAQVQIVGTADHGVTHSIYILDPDGNELELYADVSDKWRRDPAAIAAPAKPLRFD